MRHHPLVVALITVLVGGCSPSSNPTPSFPASHTAAATNESSLAVPELPEIEPSVFAKWPSFTEVPVEVGPGDWAACAGPPEQKHARNAEEDANGPHASYSIIVRVSPNAAAPFREGGTLPTGAVVVKEKHKTSFFDQRSTFDAYAFMIKREAGYDAINGDWEYAFVTLQPKRTVTRGRLSECSRCHARAADRDYLFRNYLAYGK